MSAVRKAFEDSKLVDMRLRSILRRRPTCPECHTDQLQIMNRAQLIDRQVPARFRCRNCRHMFEWGSFISSDQK